LIKKPEISPIKKLESTPPKVINQPELKEEDDEPEIEDSSHLRDALSRIKEKVAVSSKPAREEIPSTPSGGFSMKIYQMEVEMKVRSNWAYPVALQSQKDLEAVVALKVHRDGSIMKYNLIKRSNNIIFDESVIKAIERTGSMPPFPEGFNQNEEEFEITFNIKDRL
jgi:colicin import membrane protein